MLLTMKKKTVAAADFKARCLAILDEVAATGREVLITKRGKPVARVVPIEDSRPASLLGSVTFLEDIVAPFHDEWREGS